MNIKKELIDEINNKETISREELLSLIERCYGGTSRSYFYRIVSELIEQGILTKLDSYTYSTKTGISFSYFISDRNIELAIKGYGDYTLWDTNIINKWVNHLLNSVITFVEVDKELMHLVAEDLKNAGYNHVLVNPSVNEFYKYFDRHTIVIKPLTKSLIEKNHYISIERLVVELYSNKITKSLYSDNELINMLNEIFKTYKVNLNKVYHIAKRKKIYDKFHSFLVKYIDGRYLYHD